MRTIRVAHTSRCFLSGCTCPDDLCRDAPLSIVSRAGQASPFSVPAPQGHIHPGKEHRDVCATREL